MCYSSSEMRPRHCSKHRRKKKLLHVSIPYIPWHINCGTGAPRMRDQHAINHKRTSIARRLPEAVPSNNRPARCCEQRGRHQKTYHKKLIYSPETESERVAKATEAVPTMSDVVISAVDRKLASNKYLCMACGCVCM